MKQTAWVVNFVLLGAMAMVLVLGLPRNSVQAAEPLTVCDAGRSVSVSGTAVINVTPDRALIHLGVQSTGKSPSKVQEANSSTIAEVIRALKAAGIEEKDIATDWYVIEPIYESYDSMFIKGYRINNTVAVTLRDVKKTSEVIGAALEAGANQVQNVEFYISDLRTYRDQARELAMKAAAEKASALALAAGTETGCVLNIHEDSWSYYNGWWYGRNQSLWTQNTVQNAAPVGGANGSVTDAGAVSLGQISVQAKVDASFGLK